MAALSSSHSCNCMRADMYVYERADMYVYERADPGDSHTDRLATLCIMGRNYLNIITRKAHGELGPESAGHHVQVMGYVHMPIGGKELHRGQGR